MSGNYEEELQKKKAVVSLLIQMSLVDGQVDDIELQFIHGVSKELGLTEEDIRAIAANPEKFEMQPPPPEQERMTILYYVLFTMSVDGKIHEAEERMCYKVGLRLGFNEYLTRDLINVMKKFLNKEVPQNALLNEIKKHMN